MNAMSFRCDRDHGKNKKKKIINFGVEGNFLAADEMDAHFAYIDYAL